MRPDGQKRHLGSNPNASAILDHNGNVSPIILNPLYLGSVVAEEAKAAIQKFVQTNIPI